MPKNRQLVSQYLENISGDALEKYQDTVRNYIRERQGVYALFKHGKLYYVGLAHNLRSRLQTHLRDHHAGCWDRFSVYLTIGDTHLKELESLVLRIIKPKGNKQKGKFHKAESLRSRFSSDIRRIQQAEWKSVMGKYTGAELEATKEKVRGKALAYYVKKPMKLKAIYKGDIISAYVRKDGTIRFHGRKFDSPSLAAAAACKRKTCNGWTFWKYERAPGDWVRLDYLRK